MLDLMADHGELRRRLEAFAEASLTPDPVASSRMRARVLAVAHRQSSVLRADATLALVADPDVATTPTRARTWGPSRATRRAAAVLLAAALAAGAMSGVALAAQPGGGLYDARVWAETLVLPSQPRERAVAQLARLDQRLAEITAATARGDDLAAGAALAAYESIVNAAAAAAVLSDDAIAMPAIEEGIKHNIIVLDGLVDLLPADAGDAVGRALQRTIDRSTDTVDGIDDAPPNGGGGGNGPDENNSGGGGPVATGAAPTDAPKPTPTVKPTKEPRPTATAKPTATARPTATASPAATSKPAPTPRPTPEHPAPPTGGPGENGGSGPGPGSDNGEGGDSEARPTPRGQGDWRPTRRLRCRRHG